MASARRCAFALRAERNKIPIDAETIVDVNLDPVWDALWINVQLATMDEAAAADGYGTILDGALAVRDGRIAWVGPRRDLPPRWRAEAEHDGRGAWLTPGLIDCHTHLVYAGNRADEFEMRLAGTSYEEIARAGGGIASTVRARVPLFCPARSFLARRTQNAPR